MSGGKVTAPRSMVRHSSPFVNLIFPGPSRDFAGRRMAQRLLDRGIEAGGFPLPPRSRCNHRNKAALLTIQVPSIGRTTLDEWLHGNR
jgi:hypothetical protein